MTGEWGDNTQSVSIGTDLLVLTPLTVKPFSISELLPFVSLSSNLGYF